jgi:hypothetical protein
MMPMLFRRESVIAHQTHPAHETVIDKFICAIVVIRNNIESFLFGKRNGNVPPSDTLDERRGPWKDIYSTPIKGIRLNVKGWHLFIINYLLLLLVNLPNAQMRFSVDSYGKINEPNLSSEHLVLGRLSSYIATRLQELMGFDVALDQQVFFYIYLACLSACIVVLFSCIFPKLNSGNSILSVLLLNIALLFSFANVLIQEWSHYPEAYLAWGLGIMSAAYAVKYFSYSGKKRYAFISFLFLFVSVNFYQINIQLFLIFGSLILILENKFCFTRKLFIRAAKLFVVVAFAVVSNILVLKGLQLANIAWVTSRDATVNQLFDNAKIIAKLVVGELSNIPYSIIGMMLWACIILFVTYVVVAIIYKSRALSGVALMILFGIVGFFSTFGLHLVSSEVWAVPRTLVGIAFIISALCIVITCTIKRKNGRVALLIILSIAFLVNVYHVQAMSINQFANNRLDQEYAMNVSRAIDEYENSTGETVSKIAFREDSGPMYAYYGNVRYIIGDMNLRAARIGWACVPLINYYAQRDFEFVEMDEEVYDKYFKDKNWDFFVPDEQMIFIGDTLYLAVY